jgi:hypothetical protein
MANAAKTLILIQNLGYAATTDVKALLEEVSKLLAAYTSAIESNCSATSKF